MYSKIFKNAKWIIGCKIVQSLLQFVAGMLSARYLGPSNYGLISYASSVVAFAIPFMQLGLRSTLVQEYVQNPEKEGQIIGTSLVMNLISAVACIVGVTGFSMIANAGEPITILVCALYSTVLLTQSLEMLQYWFQAKLLSKYSSLAMLVSCTVMSAYKIFLLASGKSVYWFALSHTVEYGITGALLLISYKKAGTQKMSFSFRLAKTMLRRSRYYIVSSLMVVISSSISSLLLKLLIGETENGYFASAVTCCAISGFVYNAIIDTFRPVILESRDRSVAAFEKGVVGLYSLTIYLALAEAVVFTLFAPLVISVLYGADFAPAIPVLRIYVWINAFSYMGYVRNIWILGEEKHNVLWLINLCGAVASLMLNALLIPRLGAGGAAIAGVATQIFTNLLMGWILKPVRRNNYLILKSMNPKYMIELVSTVFKNKKQTKA